MRRMPLEPGRIRSARGLERHPRKRRPDLGIHPTLREPAWWGFPIGAWSRLGPEPFMASRFKPAVAGSGSIKGVLDKSETLGLDLADVGPPRGAVNSLA